MLSTAPEHRRLHEWCSWLGNCCPQQSGQYAERQQADEAHEGIPVSGGKGNGHHHKGS